MTILNWSTKTLKRQMKKLTNWKKQQKALNDPSGVFDECVCLLFYLFFVYKGSKILKYLYNHFLIMKMNIKVVASNGGEIRQDIYFIKYGMQIENVAIDKLIQYEFNNKIHDDTQIDRIANSIKEFWLKN